MHHGNNNDCFIIYRINDTERKTVRQAAAVVYVIFCQASGKSMMRWMAA